MRNYEWENLPPVLKANQVQELLGIGRVRVYELAHAGELPTIRLGRRLLFPRDALRRWLEEMTSPKTAG